MRKVLYAVCLIVPMLLFVSCNMPKKFDYEPIQTGEVITTDKIEFQINQSFITKMADANDLGIDFDLPFDDNSLYFILTGQVKNTSSSAISLIENLTAKLIFDNKYEYEVYMEPNERLKNVVPLSTELFAFYVSVPSEILLSTDNFEYQMFFQKAIDNNKHRVSLSGKTSLYDSPENIVNFHIFTEKILPLSAKYNGVSLKEIDEEAAVLKFSWNKEFKVSLPDDIRKDHMYDYYKNRYFVYYPELFLFINPYLNLPPDSALFRYITGGAILLRIDDEKSLDKGAAHVKHISFTSEGIKSEGEYSFSSNKDELFQFSAERLDSLYEIINSINPQITFDIFDAAREKGNQDIEKTIVCEPSLQEAIKTFVKFYSECPSSAFMYN